MRFHSWGGGYISQNQNVTAEVAQTCFNFSNPWGGGGVHLHEDWKSVRFMDSGWLSTAAMSGQLC